MQRSKYCRRQTTVTCMIKIEPNSAVSKKKKRGKILKIKLAWVIHSRVRRFWFFNFFFELFLVIFTWLPPPTTAWSPPTLSSETFFHFITEFLLELCEEFFRRSLLSLYRMTSIWSVPLGWAWSRDDRLLRFSSLLLLDDGGGDFLAGFSVGAAAGLAPFFRFPSEMCFGSNCLFCLRF